MITTLNEWDWNIKLIESVAIDDLKQVKECLKIIGYSDRMFIRANINTANSDGHTALMIASAEGHFEIVKYLIENGANVNLTQDRYNRTALMYASENGYLAIVELLGYLVQI